jgi:hypothetical protein
MITIGDDGYVLITTLHKFSKIKHLNINTACIERNLYTGIYFFTSVASHAFRTPLLSLISIFILFSWSVFKICISFNTPVVNCLNKHHHYIQTTVTFYVLHALLFK